MEDDVAVVSYLLNLLKEFVNKRIKKKLLFIGGDNSISRFGVSRTKWSAFVGLYCFNNCWNNSSYIIHYNIMEVWFLQTNETRSYTFWQHRKKS